MRRSRTRARLALAIASLALAASSFAGTSAHASCIINPVGDGCLNVCLPALQKLHIYCTS